MRKGTKDTTEAWTISPSETLEVVEDHGDFLIVRNKECEGRPEVEMERWMAVNRGSLTTCAEYIYITGDGSQDHRYFTMERTLNTDSFCPGCGIFIDR